MARLEPPRPAELVAGEVVADDGRGAERQDMAGERGRRDQVPRMGVGLEVPRHQGPPVALISSVRGPTMSSRGPT